MSKKHRRAISWPTRTTEPHWISEQRVTRIEEGHLKIYGARSNPEAWDVYTVFYAHED